jgi:peptidoglycan/LPS O-acetylase OafA/YrhL
MFLTNDKKVGLSDASNNFDAIRLLASLMVVLAHSFPLTGKSYLCEPLVLLTGNNDFGHFGVSIFLFVSGYLISNSARRNSNFFTFFSKRMLRMLPALSFLILISIFIIGPLFTSLHLTEYFSNGVTYAYLKNILLFNTQYQLPGVFDEHPYSNIVNGSLWTLGYEFLFYIFLFVLYLVIKNRKYILIVSCSLLLISILILNIFHQQIIQFQYTIPLLNFKLLDTFDLFNYFITGVILNAIIIPNSYIKYILVTAILLILISFCKYELINRNIFYIIVPALTYSIAFHNKIKLSVLTKFGDFSYGIYLYGFLIQQILMSFFSLDINPYVFFVVSAIIAYIIGLLSWNFIEKPCLKFKKQLNA